MIEKPVGVCKLLWGEANQVRRALSFIENIHRAPSLQSIIAAVVQSLSSYGLKHFTFQDLPDPRKYSDFVFCKRVPEEWLKLYIKEEYNCIDPAFRMLRRSNRPYVWASAPYDPEREPRTVEFIRRVHDFGLADGLMVPIPHISRRPGVVWFGGLTTEINAHTLPELHLLALYAFEAIRQRRQPAYERKPVLTSREREVLTWAAAGKTALQIGEILRISGRTVEEHAKTASRKLGTMNRTHAVALAIRDHLIQP